MTTRAEQELPAGGGVIAHLEATEDTAYAVGVYCTWHGPARTAGLARQHREPGRSVYEPCCPGCQGPLKLLPPEAWTDELRGADRRVPGYKAMVDWAEGRCFPDWDTLQNAYRQAMEE